MDYFDTLLTDWDDRYSLERKQNRSKFYDLMKEYGFDFNDVDEAQHMPKSLIPVLQNNSDEFAKFNHALAELNRKKIVSLAEAITFITTDWLETVTVLKCLDELNFYSLRTELLNKYKIQVDKKPEGNSLLDFLDADDK